MISPSIKTVYMFWLWESAKLADEVFKNSSYALFLNDVIASFQLACGAKTFRLFAKISCRVQCLANGDNAEVTVNGEGITGVNDGCGVGDAGDAGDAVFSGDDGAMNKHAATAFHNGRRQGDHEGHIGVNGIADQDFSVFKLKQV